MSIEKSFTTHKAVILNEKSGAIEDYLDELRKRYKWSNPSSSDSTKDKKQTYIVKEDPDKEDKPKTSIEVGPLIRGSWVPDDLLIDETSVNNTGYFDIINKAVDRSLQNEYVHGDEVIPITE